MTRFIFITWHDEPVNLAETSENLPKNYAIMGNVAVVNYIFESNEDDDLKDTTSPVIKSFFNIHLLTDQNDLWKKIVLYVFSNLMTLF